jgi:hypothetical protein
MDQGPGTVRQGYCSTTSGLVAASTRLREFGVTHPLASAPKEMHSSVPLLSLRLLPPEEH